ncbi:MAG TPA: bifunctional metallophosphatase/5'-nucleotidase [Ignavibacteriales bacterium]|nr:bifunctional metallophosphatase/5'-nucleotidase [Ignavibacteriales bacterium]
MRKDLVIFELNDSHGYLEPHQEYFWTGKGEEYKITGGFAGIASVINDARKNNPGKVALFDGGDTIHGTFPAVKSKGELFLPVLNEIKFDAMTAHWEFAYTPEGFKNFTRKLQYPMLAVNCYYKDTNELVFEPYRLMEVNNIRIGVIGIAATIVDKSMPEHFSTGVYFTLGNEELPHYIDKLRNDEKAGLIIVLSHLGFPQDVKLAQKVNGIDILLSAHTHNRLYKPVIINNAIIIQSGSHGSFLGKLELEIESSRIKDFSHELIAIDEKIVPDAHIESIINEALSPFRKELSETSGYTETSLNRNMILESTMDNFLLQSVIDYTGAEIAFSNGWRYGAPVPKGKVTVNDLWNIIPVNPPVMLTKITGREILEMMEENLESTFASDPWKQMGGYVKRVNGLNIYIKIENPAGQRVQEIFARGKRLLPERVYTAAYLTQQGVPKKYGTDRQEAGISAIDALKLYLGKHKALRSDLCGSVAAV